MNSRWRSFLFTLPLAAAFYLLTLGCGGETPAKPGEVVLEGTVVDVSDARARSGGVVIELRKVDWSTVILWIGSRYTDPSPPPLDEDLEKCLQALHTGDRVRATGRPGDGNLRLSGLEIVDRGGGAP
jgi:hypothetical protein